MTLSNAKIKTRKPSAKRQLIPMDGKGLYLIVEKHPLNSKRFEGRRDLLHIVREMFLSPQDKK
tara:strand:+ start:551 stop:739 length:189 start_codon:yes stop_codon:yes gene_type:complete